MRRIALIAIAALTTSAVSIQAGPRMVSQSGDWGVYAYRNGTKTNCYALSMPKEAEPAGVDHGKNYFLIAPAEGEKRKEPEAVMGYPLKEGSTVEIAVGAKTFRMFTRNNTAWVYDTSHTLELMNALRAGSQMMLKAISARGTHTTYTYSLNGVTAALKRVSNCK